MQAKKLDVKAFGVTAGLLWGLGVFFLTWWVMLFDGITNEKTFLGRLYRGYRVSPGGSLVGLLWALVDGASGGVIFAWLYNRFAVDVDQPSPVQVGIDEKRPAARTTWP